MAPRRKPDLYKSSLFMLLNLAGNAISRVQSDQQNTARQVRTCVARHIRASTERTIWISLCNDKLGGRWAMSLVRQTILVVDDEPSDLNTIGDLLVENGYAVLTASDGLDAIRIYQDRKAPIALLISDVAMNPMGGVEL